MVPYEIHKAAYEYCLTQRWYTGYREMPPLDRVPVEQPEADVTPAPPHRSIIRAPFAAHVNHLKYHLPIKALFEYINENVFDGKMELNGFHEPSPGTKYPARNRSWGDTKLTAQLPFFDPDIPGQDDEWRAAIYGDGSLAYMQAIPFESVRHTRIPHRDWKPGSLETNDKNYSTVMFVANLNWRPEWLAEFTLFEDAYGDVPGARYEDLKFNRKVGIGHPKALIDNKPGRILVQDGRQLHATKAVGETAPEPAMHINFRVTFKD